MVKGKNFRDHLQNLQIVFERFRKYRVQLNPKKCISVVISGMFLGHVMRKDGIEASSMQVQDIFQLPEPKTKKKIKILTGRIAALSRFISQMTDKCKPFAND